MVTNRPHQALYCLIYVLPLYASRSTRPSSTRSRDDPDAIRARIRAVSSSTAACSLATFIFITALGPPSVDQWHLMGLWPVGLLPAAKALLLTALLFAAPLYESLFLDGNWKDFRTTRRLREVWTDMPLWRNLVAVSITRKPRHTNSWPLFVEFSQSHQRAPSLRSVYSDQQLCRFCYLRVQV